MSNNNIFIFIIVLFTIGNILFFRKKIKCPKCGKTINAADSIKLGYSYLILAAIILAYEVAVHNSGFPYSAVIWGGFGLYYITSNKTVFCRYCMENVPLDEKKYEGSDSN